MKQRGDNGIKVKPHVSKDIGNSNRMHKIGLARGTRLSIMRRHAKQKGPVQLIAVNRGVVGFYFVIKIVCCFNHRRAKLNIKVPASTYNGG
jgi:hypothetical protein